MQIDPIYPKQTNKLISDYRNNNNSIMDFFHYRPTEDDFTQRIVDIKNRPYQRDSLAEVLHEMNRNWGAPEATLTNIQRLRNQESVVVVGGQQAGVLTGPLYAINKVISILLLAKQQEEKRQIPVIPVFWIAGEDHDFEEINHVYMPDGQFMKKYKMPQHIFQKKPVSEIEINQADAEKWLQDVFTTLGETVYTKPLYQTICDCLNQSVTYVDFFARLIFLLMKDEGLVLLDSNHPKIRQIESAYLEEFMEQQQHIALGVSNQLRCLQETGYQIALDAQPEDGHLFYHHQGERILLVRDEAGNWIGKQNQFVVSHNEIMEMARNHPEKFSNNVVTRPIMQDLLLPTLAFVGGPGEIAYWSALKPAFEAMGVKMPPVVQRLSFTLLDKSTEKLMKKYAVQLTEVAEGGIDHLKLRWLQTKTSAPVKDIANEIKNSMARIQQPLYEIANNLRADLAGVAEKNLFYMQQNVDFMEQKILKTIEEINSRQIADFDRMSQMLFPLSGLQERTWNPLPWMNAYGTDLFIQIAGKNCSFENGHYVVRI